MHIFGTLLADFWTTSPQFGYFRAQISHILAPGGSENLQNVRKYVNFLCNQTYLTRINRLGGHMHIFGTLLVDFWTTSPQFGYFRTQISHILAPEGSENLQNILKFVNSLCNQTYLTIIKRIGGHMQIF